MASEKYLEKRMREEVKKAGGWCVKLTGYENGLPDRMVLLPGAVIHFVETKSTGDDLRPTQGYVARKITGLGFPVHKVTTANELIYFLREICNIPPGLIRQ